MSRILVTGGLGFIGHNVVSKFETLGHDVIIVDTQTTYGIISLDELNYLTTERRKKIQTTCQYNIDILDQEFIRKIIRYHNIDSVVHLASLPRQKVVNSNPQLGAKTMVEGLLSLLEASVKEQVRKFVYISSSMVYGDFEDNVTETAVCSPIGQYAIMKLMGEMLTKDYAKKANMNYTILRPSAVYGPLDVTDRVVSKFFQNAMLNDVIKVNGSLEKLDFTYVNDAALGIVLATINDSANNNTYNITRGKARTLLEAATLVTNIAGEGKIQVFDKDINFPSRGQLSIEKAKVDFYFNQTIDIEQGFKLYYDYLTTHRFFWS